MAHCQGEALYVNGEFLCVDEPQISALDRGFALGDGLFETMRAYHGGVFRLDDHLERLSTSAATVKLPLPLSRDEIGHAGGLTECHTGGILFMRARLGWGRA